MEKGGYRMRGQGLGLIVRAGRAGRAGRPDAFSRVISFHFFFLKITNSQTEKNEVDNKR